MIVHGQIYMTLYWTYFLNNKSYKRVSKPNISIDYDFNYFMNLKGDTHMTPTLREGGGKAKMKCYRM